MKASNTKFMEESSDYVEKYQIFQMFESLMAELIVEKPADPIPFLIDVLKRPVVPRIIIAGPPASGKGTQCELITEKYDVVHISTGDLLRESVKRGTEVGKKAKEFMDAGELVPDSIMIEIVKEKLNQEDCLNKGWLLDGFPRTQTQAEHLQSAGVVPTKFVLLSVPDDVVVERISGRRVDNVDNKIYHLKYNKPPNEEVAKRLIQRPDDTEEKVRTRLSLFHKHVNSILPRYKNIMCVVDANRPKQEIFASLDHYLKLPPPTRAPRQSPRLVLFGKPGCGKRTQSHRLAARFGVVLVSSGELLRTAAKHGTELGRKAQRYMDTFQLVPDDVVCKLVKERLGQEDTRKHGWMLEGFPRTLLQAEFLEKEGIKTRQVVHLDVSDQCALRRLCERRLDPLDGKVYHPDGSWPSDPDTRSRLVQHPNDQEAQVNNRLRIWHDNVLPLKEKYATILFTVNGEQPEDTMEEALIKPCGFA